MKLPHFYSCPVSVADTRKMSTSEAAEPSDEERRTLWVGGISEQVDEELLYELFLNVSM